MGSILRVVGLLSKFFFCFVFLSSFDLPLPFQGELVLINCDFFRFRVSPFVQSEEGKKTQGRIWEELSAKLERIQPGIMNNV